MNWLLAGIAILGVSLSGPLMAATHAPALAIAFWRNAIGALALAPLATVARRRELRALTRRDLLVVVWAGLALAAHFATWITALTMTTVAAAIALVSTQVVWVALIERLRGVVLPRGIVPGIVISLGGMLLITGVDFTVSTRALIGDLLAVAGGFFAGLYFVIGARVRVRTSNLTYSTLCFTVSSGVLLVFALIGGSRLGGFAARDWALIVAVAVCAQLVGHFLLNHVVAHLSPTVLSLLILLEVPAAALLAAALLGQVPALGVLVGLTAIVAGLALVVLRRPPAQAPID